MNDEPAASSFIRYKGIRGWLIIPAAAVIVLLLLLIVGLPSQFSKVAYYMSISYIVDCAFSVYAIVYLILSIWHLFRKTRTAPDMMIRTCVAILIISIILTAMSTATKIGITIIPERVIVPPILLIIIPFITISTKCGNTIIGLWEGMVIKIYLTLVNMYITLRPLHYLVKYMVAFICIGLVYKLMYYLPDVYRELFVDIVPVFIACVVWTAYFIISERVQATFVP